MAPPKGSDAQRGGEVQQIESIFGSMRLTDELLDEYHPRPDFGKSGKAITVMANMFQTRFKNQGKETNSVNHYDVEVNPVVKVANQKKPRQLLWDVWNQMCAEAKGELKTALDAAAYDMVKNMYTPYALPVPASGKLEVTVALKEEGREGDDKRRFKVQFALANVIDLNTIVEFCQGTKQTEKTKEVMLVAIQAMNVLFRQDPTNRYKAVGAQGRRFFGTEGAAPIPMGGMVYNGFMQSFRWTQSGLPAVQLDTAYSAFVRAGPLVEVAAGILGIGGGGGGGGFRGGPGGDRGGRGGDRGGRGGGRGGRGGPAFGGGGGGGGGGLTEVNPRQLRKLNEILRMAKFTVTHRKTDRVFTMRGLTTQTADALKFLLNGKDGAQDRMVSVSQYMKEAYNYTVRNPRLPCVQYGAKFYLPMECVVLCEFNGIQMRSLAAEQTAEMIKVAAKPPPARMEMIMKWRNTLNYQNLPKIKAWGVEVKTTMMSVNARVLPTPQVTYGGGKSMRANFGGWNLKGVRFTKPGKPLKSWAILSLDRYVGIADMQKFCGLLCDVLIKSGCPVENQRPELVQYNPDEGGQNAGVSVALQQAARAAYQQSKLNPQLIVVILPRKEQAMYSSVKQVAAEGLLKPVVTQCLQAAKIKNDRGIEQYLGNVSMKIHAKMGGVTHEVPQPQVFDGKTMMIGADVTHPPPRGGPVPPSIAVTVAATGGDNTRFVPALRLQEGRVEIIQDLANMVYSQIQVFQKNSKALPEKILMFRDGVSEGQYGHCVKYELKAIKDAALRFGANYKPKVTFVICAKRHNMRFFANSEADKDRTGNLPPGLVVDTGVTHPFAFDFYLQAHAGLQGTAKPTHYICVADENKFSADKLQNLCNNLCYSYARATRSVSLIPVAYYSDIIATKARDFVYSEDASDAAASVTSGSGPREGLEFDPLKLKKRIEDNIDFNSVAWYM